MRYRRCIMVDDVRDKMPFKISLSLFIVTLSIHLAYAQIPEATPCDECGMRIDISSRFSNYVITMDGKRLFFCDIGDMLNNLKKRGYEAKEIHVRDYQSGEWIDGQKAYYVRNKKFSTPMGWGIGAFRDLSEAESFGSPVDLNNSFKLIK